MTTAPGVAAPLLLCALLPLGGCRDAAGSALRAGPVVTVAADSASNPTVATDPRSGRVYVAWVGVEGGANAVLLAATEGTDGFPGRPVRVNDIPGDAAPHRQAPAQVAVGPEGNVYVLWQNNTPVAGRRFPASDLRLAVSRDGGRTFSPAITVNDDAGGPPASHTFHDLAVGDDGIVLVSWIDSRARDAVEGQGAPGPGAATAGGGPASGGARGAADHGDHAPPAAAGAGEAPGPQIRVARSADGGRSFGASVVVDTGSCPCCRTSLMVAPDGAVYVAWRKIFAGGIRDVVVARAAPGSLAFGAPVRVHHDGWVFPACPHAGPSLMVADDGTVLVGWYTGKEGRQGLWYSASIDEGGSFSSPVPVFTGDFVPPSQLRLTASAGRVWAAWDDRTAVAPRVRLASGAVGRTLRPIGTGEVRAGAEPEIARAADGAVVAWLDGTAVRLRRVAPR